MYSQTQIKRMIDSVNELSTLSSDTTADDKIKLLEADLAKANLTIKDLTTKVTTLVTKVDKLEKIPK